MKVFTAEKEGNAASEQVLPGVEGFLYLPSKLAKTGAVILLHERYGVVQHSQDLGRRLADEGYVALLPDLFAECDVDKELLKKGEVDARVTDDYAAGILGKCIDFLKSHELVDPAKIVVLGVCLTGRYAIEMAGRRDDIAGSIILYGAASDRNWTVDEFQPEPMTEKISRMKAPSLLVFGETDHSISLDNIIRVRDAYEAARKSYRLRIVAEAPHGFLNDTMPGRYRHRQAAYVWSLIMEFLDEVFDRRWSSERVVWDFHCDSSVNYDFTKNVRFH